MEPSQQACTILLINRGENLIFEASSPDEDRQQYQHTKNAKERKRIGGGNIKNVELR